ncbi:ATP-dependent 6-phosphofructokinase [Streptomyces sp. TRM 70351]|uniref:ATP-dependent 6-phosphofructokinase n=1 Tax=Streptomyces sp. TRM 70351 TaxID=3116552 RepID=UPI002E7C33D5|nr:ATP-dependent 6-phosphofructokinase [Streptomyces sp. TRM 70351]MEE1928710.1 ATP-dependent 6-phosphofructokinase [Streptomyces sp. TRM 70351]
MRIGVLTGGSDCPGLNAVIRAVVRKGVQDHGDTFTGFRDGWRGVLTDDAMELGIPEVRGTLPRGGTVLGSSRTDPLARPDGPARVRATLEARRLDGLVVIGGIHTLTAAATLADEHGIPCVGVPKTIDNDISGTDYTVGFDTAVGVATETIDRLHTTAESHKRVLVVEVMGRTSGWIAIHAGLAGGANGVLIPERPFDLDRVCGWVASRFGASYAPIVVVADNARPAGEPVRLGGLSGIGEWLGREIEHRTGHESRATVLGHIQRGGTPSPFDRWLATRFGLHAVDAVHDGAWGQMVALHGQDVVRVRLADAVATVKTVDPARYAENEVFFG